MSASWSSKRLQSMHSDLGWKSELELPIDTDTGTKVKCDVYLKHPTKHRHVYIECKVLTENGFSHALGQVLRYEYMYVATLGAAQISTVKIIALNKEPSAEQRRVANEYDVWCWWPGQRLSTRLGEDEAQPTRNGSRQLLMDMILARSTGRSAQGR